MGSKYVIQGAATLGALLMMMQSGIQSGWSSPNLARLTSNSSSIKLTPEEASWVAACPGLGGFIGSILGSISIDFIGTKKTILLSSALTSAMWTGMIVADSALWLYGVRVIGGIASAFTLCSFSLYLGEVSAPDIRGTTISLAISGFPIGNVIGIIAETYLSKITSTSIYIVQCFISLLIFAWLMDSPYYLIKIQDEEGARKSISSYDSECKVEEALKVIKVLVDSDANQDLIEKLGEFKSTRNMKFIALIILLFSLLPLSGGMILKSYMEVILTKGKFSLISPADFVIYANIVDVTVNFLTVRLIDQFGRRLLLMVSSIGCAIAMILLGLHFYLLSSGYDAQRIQWLPVFCIIFSGIMVCIGYSRVPNTALSEILPQNIKSIGTCVACMSTSSTVFLTLKCYQPLVDIIGEAYVFWLLAFIPFVITLFVLSMLPETKGKSLHEIQCDLTESHIYK